MGFLGSVGHFFTSTAKDAGQIATSAAKAAGSGITTAANAVAGAATTAYNQAGKDLKAAGMAVADFATHPLATFNLPQGYGTVEIWPAVYRIFLTKYALDKVSAGGNVAVSVASLGGAIVGASGGTLAPVAGIIAAYLAVEWTTIQAVANSKGVTLNGTYVPPSPVLVPLPA